MMNAKQRRAAADFLTKPLDLGRKWGHPECGLGNYNEIYYLLLLSPNSDVHFALTWWYHSIYIVIADFAVT